MFPTFPYPTDPKNKVLKKELKIKWISKFIDESVYGFELKLGDFKKC